MSNPAGYNYQYQGQASYQYRYAGNNTQQAPAVQHVPKEDATTYYDLAIAGERVIAPAHEKASSRLQQDPPIIFNYRNQVGIPLGVLHFNRNVPLQGRGCAPFPTASAGANITIKGYDMLTGEQKTSRFAVTGRYKGQVVYRDVEDLARFITEQFLPMTPDTDVRNIVKKVRLWKLGEKKINPFNDLILVALEHSPSDHAWFPVIFCRQ